MTTKKSPKEIAIEYTDAIWNTKDLTIIDKLVHQDVLIHSLLGDFHGVNHLKEVVETWLKGFPDLRVKSEMIIAENDLVTIQWQAKGTHKGEFKEKKPTLKPVFYKGVTIYRIKDEKIVEYSAFLDMQHLLGQL